MSDENETRIESIIRYFRENAEGHRETFPGTNPPGGKNAAIYDLWADEVDGLRAELETARTEAKVLRAVNEKLRAAVNFYASEKNWDDRWVDPTGNPEDEGDSFDVISAADVEWFEDKNKCPYGGKLARETLAAIEAPDKGEGEA